MAGVSAQWLGGVAFGAATLWFLWKVFEYPGLIDERRYSIVLVVCALCAGACGAFIAGAALVDMHLGGDENRVAFQGTAGAALFALVFFGLQYRRRRALEEDAAVRPAIVTISIGTHTPFKQVAESVAREAGASVDLSAFTPQELRVIPNSDELRTGTLGLAQVALEQLRELLPARAVRPYTVQLDVPAKKFVLVVQQLPRAIGRINPQER